MTIETPARATPVAPPVASPQVASVGLDGIRRQIAQYIAGRRCALLAGDIRDGGAVALDGKLIDLASIRQAQVIVKQSELIAAG